MAEKLLTTRQAGEKLGVSRATFYRHRPALIAKGLRCVRVGGGTKYLESSLDRLILKAADTDIPLC